MPAVRASDRCSQQFQVPVHSGSSLRKKLEHSHAWADGLNVLISQILIQLDGRGQTGSFHAASPCRTDMDHSSNRSLGIKFKILSLFTPAAKADANPNSMNAN